MDERFRWARFGSAGLEAVGQPPRPLQDPVLAAQDAVELSRDPAKGGKVDDKSLEEAAVAVLAEHLGVLSGVRREKTGHSEFTDEQARLWDVKSPLSPDRPGWIFDPAHHLEVVQEDLDQGEGILLDMTRLNRTDSVALLSQLGQGLSVQQTGHLLVLLDQTLL
jgi:hypothetical protein